jgi:hypothetical protein
MDIALVRSTSQRKNPRLVVFKIEGRPGSVQFFRTLFPNDEVPATLTLTGDFAAPKVKETPEQRKARLKALPKPTAAEKLTKMEARLAKMKAKLAAASNKFVQPESGIVLVERFGGAPEPTPAPRPAAQPMKAAETPRGRSTKGRK